MSNFWRFPVSESITPSRTPSPTSSRSSSPTFSRTSISRNPSPNRSLSPSLSPVRRGERIMDIELSFNNIYNENEKPLHPDGEDELGVHEEYTCIICYINKVRMLSSNCTHLCCCIGCSKVLYNGPIEKRKCPICRGEWTNLLKIH